ncbi:TetR/AcrR family transcriptional regulator [Edaphovirga cremea]|uniref:TetR/AcrR family transcriptional regulator n=1 Tax=Edaphovirga cremea TaxID=2267246 RepID=UPI000DEEEAA1|nr:TetR/AcrR family transcriptional regulator [Edaphovirga cremea]
MKAAINRPKEPETVKRSVVEAASKIIADKGLQGLTLDNVAQLAGVSKGGLQYHFSSKTALINGLFNDLMQRFSDDMADLMRLDTEPYGRATRAYLRACTAGSRDSEHVTYRALVVAILADRGLRERWNHFVNNDVPQEDLTGEEQDRMIMCRMAVDGLWLSDICGYQPLETERRERIINKLNAMTLKEKGV